MDITHNHFSSIIDVLYFIRYNKIVYKRFIIEEI